MTKPPHPATLEDVAALAEVSAKTVSRVVNAEPTVSEKTRQRVQRAIELLDYKPNLSARMLAGERSYLIGLFYDKPGSYLTEFHAGATDRCRESGYHLMLESGERDNAQFTRQVATLLRQMPLDGVILLPPLSDDAVIVNILRDAATPVVQIAPREHTRDSPSIGVDDYLAARQLTAHLLSLGHRRIGCILGKPGHGATEERYRGFIDEMRAQNAPLDLTLFETGNFVFAEGVPCAQRLLSVPQPPTAIFASNDDMAAAVVSVAHRLGLELPTQLSVVGFDDAPVATMISPLLTTVRQPLADMARLAAGLIIEHSPRRQGWPRPAPHHTLDFELIVRDSTAAPGATPPSCKLPGWIAEGRAGMKRIWISCAVLLCVAVSVSSADVPQATSVAIPQAASTESDSIRWLEERSMLYQAQALARRFSGNSAQWQRPYGTPQPRVVSARASVWFTAYPASTIAASAGESVLATLADERLWSAFQAIGIQAIHTGPMKRSGGITGTSYTPSVDGNFDRISFEIDPDFGTQEQYKALVQVARAHGALVIGDVIPGHTGKGADFRLAERAYGDYPGIYHMVRIDPADWSLLPPVPAGHDSVNLSPASVDALQRKGYIVGMLSSRIFYQPGVKDSDWSATEVVRGADGVERRWVYLHYFKEGQPTLDWLDPTFAAQRLVIGDILHEITVLGDGGVRLDANGLLGIERNPTTGEVWSAGHPLADTANQLMSDMARKVGGFTFQELALAFDELHEMSHGGADLSYDFVTRPAYDQALLSGDAQFLRLIFQLMRRYQIDSGGLIHALQNHDELTMGLAQFAGPHANDQYSFRGTEMTGKQLRDTIQEEMYSRLIGDHAPYNLKFGDGVASTTATVITAALGINDITKLRAADVEKIKRLHLLLAFYNAFQPGVFALSGWDLVGALTLPPAAVKNRLADGDTRWINRGAYDLIGSNPKATGSAAGLPVAVALYGALPRQLRQKDSFASQLARMLKVRATLRLYAGELVDAPAVHAKGLFIIVHRLPDGADLEVTAINFGSAPIDASVVIRDAQPGSQAADVLDTTGLDAKAPASTIGAGGELHLTLRAFEGKALRIMHGSP